MTALLGSVDASERDDADAGLDIPGASAPCVGRVPRRCMSRALYGQGLSATTLDDQQLRVGVYLAAGAGRLGSTGKGRRRRRYER